MLPASHIPLPIPEPLALLDATLVFLMQVLIAQHPDLLDDPEDRDDWRPSTSPLRAARHVLFAIRETHYALDSYRNLLPDKPSFMSSANANDDFPF
ncbi:MAG: hypothetical protein JOZ69_05070 [Myxococcales bacterium]|nr:hypothetical protein [Myxococcales bacterium]